MNFSSFIKHFFDASFLRFVLVGVVNTLFGMTIMFVFYNVFHFGYWFSSASNYVLASILSYFLNKYFTFRAKGDVGRSAIRFAINIAICYLIAYGIAKPLMMWLLSDFSQTIQENVAMLTGAVLFVGFNYCGQRFFVFKKSKVDNDVDSSSIN